MRRYRMLVLVGVILSVSGLEARADSCPTIGGYGLKNEQVTPSTQTVTIGQPIAVSGTLCFSTLYDHSRNYTATLKNTRSGQTIVLTKDSMGYSNNHLSGTFNTSGLVVENISDGDQLTIELSASQSYCCAGIFHACQSVCVRFDDRKDFNVTLVNGWTKKALDDSRGFCTFNAQQGQCTSANGAGTKNCWKCDDVDRDHLDMTATDLNNAMELKPGGSLPRDGRYIYVFRGDNKIFVRSYDRSDDPDSTCNKLYARYAFPGNKRGDTYLHVRHSQLNNGWDPLWTAGEMQIWHHQVTRINDKSGHFKPSPESVNDVVGMLRAWSFPISPNLKFGSFQRPENQADLSPSQCWTIFHDEL